MSHDPIAAACDPRFSFDELLRLVEQFPRGFRRVVTRDLRSLVGVAASRGISADRVRFRAVICQDCGALEVALSSDLFPHLH